MAFNFKPLATEPTKPPAPQTSLEEKVANFQFKPPIAEPTKPASQDAADVKVPNPNPTAAEIMRMELPTDDYQWDGQPITNEDEALDTMQRQLQLLRESFGSDGIDTALYRCLNFLDQHAFLKDILQPEDVQVMMRGLSMSAAEVVEAKTTNRKKRAKREETQASMAADLGDIDLGI